MSEELTLLNRKVKVMLENRELPEEIKEKIERIYNDYRNFYEDYLRKEIMISSNEMVSSNVQNYFEENYNDAMNRIQNKYKEKCLEKSEVIEILVSTLDTTDEQIEKMEIDILSDYIKNDRENYGYANDIMEIVVDSIKDSRNQLFRVLDSLGTTEQKLEYIDSQINLIENSAKLKTMYIQEDLSIDDERIAEEIFTEYEQYKKQKNNKEQNEEKSDHQKFVDQYRVSEKELQIVHKADENEKNRDEEEYGLPGNVIE